MIRVDNLSVVRPDMEITMENVGEFRSALQECVSHRGTQIIVDLERVGMITTPGISAMIEAARQIRDTGGKVALARPQPTVAGVLKRLRLGGILETVQGLDEAVQLLDKP